MIAKQIWKVIKISDEIFRAKTSVRELKFTLVHTNSRNQGNDNLSLCLYKQTPIIYKMIISVHIQVIGQNISTS